MSPTVADCKPLPTVPSPAGRFAARVFFWAGIYGIVVLAPQYVLSDLMAEYFPPAPNRLEQFYGFVGVALAWQAAFLIIAGDPVRYRPLMPAAVAEKALFGVPTLVLVAQGRVHPVMAGAAGADVVLGVLFAVAWWRLGRVSPETVLPTARSVSEQ